MTYKHLTFAPGLTAIAAVLALSATPVVAQDSAAPTTETLSPPAPSADPAPVVSDPLAPETQATTAPPEAATTTTRTTRTNRTATRPAARASASRAERAAPAPAAAAPAPAIEPTAPAATDPTMIPPPVAPVAEPAPAPAAEPVATDTMDDILPIAGAAGAGVLALAGLGLAVRRRRRKREEEQWAYGETVADKPVMAEPEPVIAREPVPATVAAPVAAMAAPRRDETVQVKPRGEQVSAFAWGNQSFVKRPEPRADPIPSKDDIPVIEQTTTLPEDFDLSRFGRHVQAAYQGPTAANPSLSLKNRLRRASYFDKVERDTGEPHPLVAKELEHQH